MSEAEAEQIISIEFNPIRCGFRGSEPVFVRDVLNLGVSPITAIQLVWSCPRRLTGRSGFPASITFMIMFNDRVSTRSDMQCDEVP